MACVLRTFSGSAVNLLDPRPQDIHIADIAHSLSHLCRFNGHCARYYSVAEHCVHVSRLTERGNALWGLLHDSAEAYVGDLVRPVRAHPLLTGFESVEHRVLKAVCQRFHLLLPMPEDVIRADRLMLHAEMARWFRLPLPDDGSLIDDSEVQRLCRLLKGWDPREAKIRFLERYEELASGEGIDVRF